MILNGKEYVELVDPNIASDKSEIIENHRVIWNSIREHLHKARDCSEKTNRGSRTFDRNKDTYLKNQKLSNASERYSKKLGLKYIPVNIVKQVGTNTYIAQNKIQ